VDDLFGLNAVGKATTKKKLPVRFEGGPLARTFAEIERTTRCPHCRRRGRHQGQGPL
jgi:hypothetical protein